MPPRKSLGQPGRKKPAPPRQQEKDFPVVGIGASAGGLEAFEQFFAHLSAGTHAAFVLVPHLDPSHTSMMSDLIRRYTRMQVRQAEDGMRVEPQSVYVIPPNEDIAIQKGFLKLTPPEAPRGLRMPIDFFLRSLAEDRGDRSIGIILSGNGSDGTLGLKAIVAAGGMCMVQDPASAAYDGMPTSAINAGLADYILPPEKMPEQMIAYLDHSFAKKGKPAATVAEKAAGAMERAISLIRIQTGHDFSFYKRSTIQRRIERRMNLHAIPGLPAYVRYLHEHPDEVQMLFKELLIGVTSFFRDPEAFEILKEVALKEIFRKRPLNDPLRVWVPGCSSGEEAYSIAMTIREYLDTAKQECKVQIFATDIDEGAIASARAGLYPSNIMADLTPERLRRFFIKEGNAYYIRKDIREMVVFAVQNVIKDAPFTRMDLVSCRNLLIYMDADLQNKLLPVFHYSLKPGGLLFLGSSESVGQMSDLFRVMDKKWKIFQRKESAPHIPPAMIKGMSWAHEMLPKEARGEVKKVKEVSINDLARKVILDSFAPPCVIINEKGDILFVQGRTGRYLEPAAGTPSLNIMDMAREGVRFELRSAIHNAATHKKDAVFKELQIKTNGNVQKLNLIVKPLTEPQAMQGLLMVVFEELPSVKPKKRPHGRQKIEHGYPERIEELERELKYSRESLQATIEEMQASNEELKSANEELQSTNEELQSTNEELETSKEEMQSMNEELVTVNSELQAKIEQLSRAENDMKNLLDNTNIGTIFLDNDMKIKRFTPEAARIINLIPTDVGRPLSHIATNLAYGKLLEDAQKVLDSLATKESEVLGKDGSWYLLRIMPYRTVENVIDGVVLTFTDISKLKKAEAGTLEHLEAVKAGLEHTESILDTIREGLLVLDKEFKVVKANRAFCKMFRVGRDETEGRVVFELGDGQWDIPELRRLLEKILPEKSQMDGFEVAADFPGVGSRKMLVNARRVIPKTGQPEMILLAIEDVTAGGASEKG